MKVLHVLARSNMTAQCIYHDTYSIHCRQIPFSKFILIIMQQIKQLMNFIQWQALIVWILQRCKYASKLELITRQLGDIHPTLIHVGRQVLLQNGSSPAVSPGIFSIAACKIANCRVTCLVCFLQPRSSAVKANYILALLQSGQKCDNVQQLKDTGVCP